MVIAMYWYGNCELITVIAKTRLAARAAFIREYAHLNVELLEYQELTESSAELIGSDSETYYHGDLA